MKVDRTQQYKNYQQGLTLVELMISLALGLLVLAGALSVTFTSMYSVSRADVYRNLNERGKYALETLQFFIQHAGFPGAGQPAPIRNGTKLLLPIVLNQSGANLTTDGTGSNADTIAVSAFNLPGGIDCSGNAIPNNSTIITQFAIIPATTTQPAALGCRTFQSVSLLANRSDGLPAITNPTAPFVRLIENIENMQIMYLMQYNNKTLQYINATDLAALPPADLENIKAVKVSLLVAGVSTTTSGILRGNHSYLRHNFENNYTYNLLDAPNITPNDGLPRQVFEGLFQLKSAKF